MEELKKQIINLCNESNLPLEAVVFVLKDAWRDASDTLKQLQSTAATEQQKD